MSHEQSLHPPNLQSQITSNMSIQTVIMHQICPQRLLSDLGDYPMGCIPIGTSTVLGLQIRYLETNGIFNIYVIVHQDSVTKTRSFLLQHYEADERSNIYLVVVKEEETESTNALKMMCEL